MFTRAFRFVVASSVVLAACGADEAPEPECMGTEMSTPNQANDPCPQDSEACTVAGGKAYAMCVDGQWSKRCMCIPQSNTAGTGMTSMPAKASTAICGDGVITAPNEACDNTNLNAATCASLGFNGGGTLLCNATTCNYDTIMCRMSVTPGTGTGGTNGGGGMNGGGTGG